MELNRRNLITGLVSFVAAPAIVRVGSLMPVKVMEPITTMASLGMAETTNWTATRLQQAEDDAIGHFVQMLKNGDGSWRACLESMAEANLQMVAPPDDTT